MSRELHTAGCTAGCSAGRRHPVWRGLALLLAACVLAVAWSSSVHRHDAADRLDVVSSCVVCQHAGQRTLVSEPPSVPASVERQVAPWKLPPAPPAARRVPHLAHPRAPPA